VKKYDVMHAEKYTSGGEEKTRWVRCGAVLQKRGGGFALKLDVIPISSDGWFQLFEPRDEQQTKKQAPRQQQAAPDDPDDSIPF